MAEIEGLVRALREGDDAAKATAARKLGNLAACNDANEVLIAEAGGIPPLVDLLRNGSAAAKARAVWALENVACNDANRVLIAEAGGIPPLIKFLHDGRTDAKKWAAWALWYLTRDNNDGNKVLIVKAGGIPPLVELLRDESADAKNSATCALQNLASTNDANAVAIAAAVGLEALVPLARRGRVVIDGRLRLPTGAGIAKRKAALVVAVLLRDRVGFAVPRDMKMAIGSFL